MEDDESYEIYRPEQKNEFKEMIEEVNSDAPEQDGFSKIDTRTRLHDFEIGNIAVVDFCVSMGLYPSDCSKLTRSLKRLKVSKDGLGRQEMVEIVRAKREEIQKSSMIDDMRGKI